MTKAFWPGSKRIHAGRGWLLARVAVTGELVSWARAVMAGGSAICRLEPLPAVPCGNTTVTMPDVWLVGVVSIVTLTPNWEPLLVELEPGAAAAGVASAVVALAVVLDAVLVVLLASLSASFSVAVVLVAVAVTADSALEEAAVVEAGAAVSVVVAVVVAAAVAVGAADTLLAGTAAGLGATLEAMSNGCGATVGATTGKAGGRITRFMGDFSLTAFCEVPARLFAANVSW